MVLTAITQSFQSYALRMVQDTLRRISAPVKLTDHVGEEEEVLYDDPTIADSEKAIVRVKDVNFWKRALLDFDLVSIRRPFNENGYKQLIPRRGLQNPTCSRR